MFFPFSWSLADFSLIWPDTILCLLVLWVGAAFLIGFRAAFWMTEPKKVASGKYEEHKDV